MWSTERRVRQRCLNMWSTSLTIFWGKGPKGACRTSQCLSIPGWRLKLGQRGARRSANLWANCGAGVKGEWHAGGAIIAKNGLLLFFCRYSKNHKYDSEKRNISLRAKIIVCDFFQNLCTKEEYWFFCIKNNEWWYLLVMTVPISQRWIRCREGWRR